MSVACRIMRAALASLFNDRNAEIRGKLATIYGGLIAANVLAWVWALVAFRDYPMLMGTAFLAYAFGLRHAVDADHIAAIDNVTRKLMQEGKRPLSVGLFFSLGHSTVVVLASAAVALTASALQDRFEEFEADRRHNRHIDLGDLSVSRRRCELHDPAFGLSHISRSAARRHFRRGGCRSPAGAAWISRPRVQAVIRHRLAKLAHVSARTAVRARFRYRNRDRRARHLSGGSIQRIADLVDHGISRRCSLRACRSSTPPTAC